MVSLKTLKTPNTEHIVLRDGYHYDFCSTGTLLFETCMWVKLKHLVYFGRHSVVRSQAGVETSIKRQAACSTVGEMKSAR